MRGQRRYGTATAKSSGLLVAARGMIPATRARQVSLAPKSSSPSAAPTYDTPDSRILLHGPQPTPLVEQLELPAEGPSSEREPLLLGSGHVSAEGGREYRQLGGRWNGRSASAEEVNGWSGGVFSPGSSRRDNGKVVTTVLVLSYMIGSGILNSSQVFSESGVAAATILYVSAAAATWFGLVVMILAAEAAFPRGDNSDGGRLADLDFADLAAKTVGSYGAISVDVSIVVQNVGDVCSYVILLGALTSSLLEEWTGIDAAWTSFSVVTPVVLLLLVFPPCLIRHLSNLRWLSAVCLLAVTAVVCFVIIGGPIYAREYRSAHDHDPGLYAPVVYWDWLGSLAKMGSIVFALSCSVAALHAYTAMFPRTERAWRSVVAWAIAMGIVLCYSTGLVGYLSFRDATDGDILDNFDGAVASCFKGLMALHLVLYIPGEVVVMRHSIFALRGGHVMEADFWPVAWVTFAVLAFITASMVSLEAAGIAEGDLFGYILDLTGGIAGSATSFILPGLAYLGATREEAFTSRGYGQGRSRYTYYRTGCQALVVLGVMVMIVVPIGVVVDMAS